MEEIPNNHLGCKKPCKYWGKVQPQLVQDFWNAYLIRPKLRLEGKANTSKIYPWVDDIGIGKSWYIQSEYIMVSSQMEWYFTNLDIPETAGVPGTLPKKGYQP